MSAAGLISSHMNAPYGPLLSEADVLNSLANGRLSAISEQANAILGAMFCELTPELIARCAVEANVPLTRANDLYLDTLLHGFGRCPAWEQAAEMLA